MDEKIFGLFQNGMANMLGGHSIFYPEKISFFIATSSAGNLKLQ